MWIIKIPAGGFGRMGKAHAWPLFSLCLLAIFLAGCNPPGAQALLKGERLIEQGKYAEAVERLRLAASILSTNAQAWNYLGLACHHTGRSEEARNAYRRALLLDPNLTEAHYNLGELLFQLGELEAARTELTTYTLSRPNAVPGLLKLTAVQLRLRDFVGAEKSASDALRYNPESPEALSALGLTRVYRGRAADAVQFFDRALKAQPDYRPALLNSAIVLHQQLHNREAALQRYRLYVSLKPTPPDAAAVIAIIRQLESQRVAVPPPQPAVPTNRVPVAVVTNPPPQHPQSASNALAATLPPPQAPKAKSVAAVAASPPSKPAVVSPPPPPPVETVRLVEEPEIKLATDLPPARPATAPQPPATAAKPQPADATAILAKPPEPPPRRNLFSRLNPLKLLGKDAEKRLPPPKVISTAGNLAPVSNNVPPSAVSTPPRKYARYQYRSPGKPPAGNRAAAQPFFLKAHMAQENGQLADAIRDYTEALRLDPSLFEGEYNLALALSESGKTSEALAAYERALAIKPDSADARYNLALSLKEAGYVPDAAKEFERILKANPADTRSHLAVANLYAQNLGQKKKAREHYAKVIELEPGHPQAGVINYWLADNPD